MPGDCLVHITVAWAVGGFMAFLAEGYRRQMFASQLLAASAHEKELLEARARIKAQRQLAAAQAQVGSRIDRSTCATGAMDFAVEENMAVT